MYVGVFVRVGADDARVPIFTVIDPISDSVKSDQYSVSVYAHWHVLYCQCVLQSLIQPA